MRGIILAAGRGSRLRHLGAERPKCLVELMGTRLLDLQVEALRRAGIAEIAVVRGYQGQMIDLPELTYFHNARWAQTNMVASLRIAAEWLRTAPALVSYADIFFRSQVVAALAATPGPLVISYDRDWRRLWERRFEDPLADAETFRIDAQGRLLEIGGRTASIADIQGQYMGLLKFTPAGWEIIEGHLRQLDAATADRLDMTGLLRRLLAGDALPIGTCATRGNWGEIDNPEDVALYEQMLRHGEIILDTALIPAPVREQTS